MGYGAFVARIEMSCSEQEEGKILGRCLIRSDTLGGVVHNMASRNCTSSEGSRLLRAREGMELVVCESFLPHTSLLKLASVSLDMSMETSDTFGWLDPNG